MNIIYLRVKFEAKGIWYEHKLIDYMVAQALKSERGGLIVIMMVMYRVILLHKVLNVSIVQYLDIYSLIPRYMGILYGK